MANAASSQQPWLFPTLGALALGCAWLLLDSVQTPLLPPTSDDQMRPRYALAEAHWQRFDDSGTPIFSARADRIEYFDDTAMQLTQIELTTHGVDGHWQLDAARGHVAAGDKQILLEPEVHVRGSSSALPQLQWDTPTLWVNWAERTLRSDDTVLVRAPGRSLQARGLHGDWSAQRLSFLHDVEVHHEPR